MHESFIFCNFASKITMQRKEIYRKLCEREDIPLLGTYAWMEAISVGKEWDVVFVWTDPTQQDADHVAAAMPVHLWSRFGQRAILMPQLTMHCPIYCRPNTNTSSIYRLLAEELDQYCRAHHICYCYLKGEWPEEFRTSLSQKSYSLVERKTHRIQPGQNREEIIAHYSENKRRQLRHAQGLTKVELTSEDFYDFHRRCLEERGECITYSLELLQTLFTPMLERKEAVLWGAMNTKGELLAGLGLVWDKSTCYYLLPAYWRPGSKSGAMAWLTTEAIVSASENGLVFDFEGGNEGGIARSYREFGGVPATYHSAEKFYSPLFRFAYQLHTHIQRL